MLNLSPLFNTSTGEPHLLKNLDITKDQRDEINEARNAVRNCLRDCLPKVLQDQFDVSSPPNPRFFTQGSWAYKTINAPAKNPQQADIDDGCYLPLSFVANTERPSIAANIFFKASEQALKALLEIKGWRLTSKATCIRVIIADYAHIDIPLYAIPDNEFVTLSKASMEHGHGSLSEAMNRSDRDSWVALPHDKVLLAHRENNWMPSDPRPVKTWFQTQVEVKGEQFRRIVRYLKAFRDWKWSTGGPSSILLMTAAAPFFEKHNQRDDLALLNVVKEIPEKLRSGVYNPVDSSESLTDRLGKDAVEEAAQAFEEFERSLSSAIYGSRSTTACITMQELFGSRFPYDPNRVVSVSVEDTITATPAKAGPSELVGRTKAG
ncbi:CBASS cGAMP synthase [Marinomonas atlantica]|uniref:CBASS cGAMP synthase n=1 Tax=Marinomonas atlantica TaxID=1806668 RepID=UPI0008309E2F|nr:hypothetical protein [Marinomonas atlantica]